MGCTCSSGPGMDWEEKYDYSDITIRFEEESTYPSDQTVLYRSNEKFQQESSCNFSILESRLSEIKCKNLTASQSKPKPYIIASSLMKYSPGLTFQFIPRYCLLTDSTFSYYKSIHSYTLDENPLYEINLQDIQSVSQYDLVSVSYKTGEKFLKFEKSNNLYQFEIFLNNSIKPSLSESHLENPSIKEEGTMRSSKRDLEESIEEGKLMVRPSGSFSPLKTKNNDKVSWTFRQVEWWTAEKRLLFSAKDQEEASRWVDSIKAKIINN